MADAGRRKTGGYSLGMRQRLGLATALLGDPQVLILDEPANGLDPEGIQWLRNFLQHNAHDQGRTILVSSHLLSEVQQTVDRIIIIIIIAAGKLVREGTIAELAEQLLTLFALLVGCLFELRQQPAQYVVVLGRPVTLRPRRRAASTAVVPAGPGSWMR